MRNVEMKKATATAALAAAILAAFACEARTIRLAAGEGRAPSRPTQRSALPVRPTRRSALPAPTDTEVIDFGPGGRCGVAVFKVDSRKGEPVLRIAYANHPDGLGPGGCFTRETSATYLGKDVELPVLPANPGRHELYRICRTGVFVAPLVQAHARYAKLSLDTPGEVEISSFALENAGSWRDEKMQGSFECSDERWTKLWRISAWTAQIASVPDGGAWRVAGGRLLPRKLAASDGAGMCKTAAPCDGRLVVEYEFAANPHLAKCAFDIIAGGRRTTVVQDSTNRLSEASAEIRKGETFGFFTPKESWPLVKSVRIEAPDGKTRWSCRFDETCALDGWEYAKAFPFLADGAKRDRLVWSGDLWWAQRNVFCAFAPDEDPFIKGSLELLAMSQLPSGYVQACPYAEISSHPADGEYGPFPSDEFSAWFIPVLADWWLYTGDRETLGRLYPAAKKAMAYLEAHLAADGTFAQRRETSKHACNLRLGDVSHRSYMDILLWKCRIDFADLAEAAGDAEEAKRQRAEAARLAAAVRRLFALADGAGFAESDRKRSFGFEANALALATGFADGREAAAIAPRLVRNSHGKFQALAARGMVRCGMVAEALAAIERHNWTKLLDPGWKGTATTTECMSLHRKGWGDESHPDTAIAGILTSGVLGVEPSAPGYSRWSFRPRPCAGITSAAGRVPVPGGRAIGASWETQGSKIVATLVVPDGTQALLDFPAGYTLLAAECAARNIENPGVLEPGSWTIVAKKEAK